MKSMPDSSGEGAVKRVLAVGPAFCKGRAVETSAPGRELAEISAAPSKSREEGAGKLGMGLTRVSLGDKMFLINRFEQDSTSWEQAVLSLAFWEKVLLSCSCSRPPYSQNPASI
jgi:hypothetical protein